MALAPVSGASQAAQDEQLSMGTASIHMLNLRAGGYLQAPSSVHDFLPNGEVAKIAQNISTKQSYGRQIL